MSSHVPRPEKSAPPSRDPAPTPLEPGAPELMDSVDHAWLAMDQRDNPMIVTAILELAGVGNVPRFARAVTERLARHVRFRQRADEGRSPAVWTTLDSFDPAYHVRILRPRGIRTPQGLRDALSREIDSDLDHAFPLWRLTLFPGPGGKLTLLFRAHHALADGIALMRLLLQLMEPEATPPQPAQTRPRKAHDGPLGAVIDRLETVNRALVHLRGAARTGLDNPIDALRAVGIALGSAAAIGRVLTRPDNNPPCFRRPLTGKRRLDWSQAVPLEPLRRAAHQSHLSLNDLFLAALAGAFGQYLRGLGPLRETQNLRVSIPVNLRPTGDESLGNRFGLVLLDLPVGVADAAQRRAIVSRRMTRLKRSMEARAVLAGLAAVGHLPVFAEKRLVNLVAGKACAVVSNLPGPDHVLKLGAARLVRAIFWPPQTGSIGLGVSILSYAGSVSLAACSDTGVLADPASLVRPFEEELEELAALHPVQPGVDPVETRGSAKASAQPR